MAQRRVDYDRIAPGYDRRYAADVQALRGEALLGLAGRLQARQVLEVGCGTGHWLAAMVGIAPEVYGLDPSIGMLRQAQKREIAAHLVQGYARHLPFERGTFDLVFCVNALHHFYDPRAFVAEAYRLLRDGGALAVVGTNPQGCRESWYIYDYFKGTYETDLGRFPTWETVSGWMAAAGFGHITLAEVERIHDLKHGRAVLDAPFLRKDSCSQLALLTDEAFEAGLRRIKTNLARAEARGETLIFPTDLSIDMLTGHIV